MVRQLYAESLIEKHGDRIKHVSRGSILEGGRSSSALVPTKGNMDEQNRKRKAEDQVVIYIANDFGFKKWGFLSNVREERGF